MDLQIWILPKSILLKFIFQKLIDLKTGDERLRRRRRRRRLRRLRRRQRPRIRRRGRRTMAQRLIDKS